MTVSKPHHRWYHVTPDRLILGLLAVEGLLWLSERFRWFAVNQHKGWTVLIAIATIGVTLLFMSLWFAVAHLFRWRFQFSIRSLLVLTVAVAVPCSWLSWEMKKAREQKKVVDEIVSAGGSLGYDWQCDTNGWPISNAGSPGCEWLRYLLQDDFLADVVFVDIEPEFVNDGYYFTDDELEHLERFSQLKVLNIQYSAVTDAGLEYLKGLTQLKRLQLDGTNITDAGLKHGMSQLLLKLTLAS